MSKKFPKKTEIKRTHGLRAQAAIHGNTDYEQALITEEAVVIVIRFRHIEAIMAKTFATFKGIH